MAGLTSDPPAPGRTLRLQGDLAMWFVIGIEMLTFGLLFIAYAVARQRELVLFRQGQATLDLHMGAFNTVLLLTGSWCAARAVHAVRADRVRPAARWAWAAAACGAAFVGIKSIEYAGKFAAGFGLSTDTFFMFYFLLTGFHWLHVAAATLILAGIAWLLPRRPWGARDAHAPETAAAFWHMVDLLWVVLFPLVYVLR